eukprot:gene27127-41980_t
MFAALSALRSAAGAAATTAAQALFLSGHALAGYVLGALLQAAALAATAVYSQQWAEGAQVAWCRAAAVGGAGVVAVWEPGKIAVVLQHRSTICGAFARCP